MFTLLIQAYHMNDTTMQNRTIVKNFMNTDAGRNKAEEITRKFAMLTTQDVDNALLAATSTHAYFTEDLAADLLTKAASYADKFVANKGKDVTSESFHWAVKCAAKAYGDENLTRANRALADLIANTAEDAVEKALTNASSYDTLSVLDMITFALRNRVAMFVRDGHTDKATRFLDTFKAKVDEHAMTLKDMDAVDAQSTMQELIRLSAREVLA